MMRVGLNLAFLSPGVMGGLEVYARRLARALAERADVELTLFLARPSRDEPGWHELGRIIVVGLDPGRRIDWVRADQLAVPLAAARADVDVLHSLASTAPLWSRAVRVTTIHDLNYKLVPDSHFGLRGAGMRMLVPAAARRSHRVIADSASTRDDLVAYLRLDPARIDVAPLAAALPSVSPAPERALRERLGLGDRPVVLSASAKRPHKNVARLIDALARISRERRPMLVVPGYPTPYEAELRRHAQALGAGDDVAWPSWLPDEDLEGLHALATCVVFPSLYEGFGLPVLEAMERGVPVACSDRSSLPEVAGDAALLFDPEDTDAIQRAIERLLGDADLRTSLVRRGREQAARFTWHRTAELTVASYERALSQPA